MALNRLVPALLLVLAFAARAEEAAPPADAPPATAPAPAAAPTQITPPQPLELPEIPYPAGAKTDRDLVDVEVKFVITAQGTVRDPEILHGAGEPFDSAVLEGVKRFRFSPALADGKPIDVAVPFTQHFVVPRAPAPVAAESGPKKDAVLLGLVVERGTRKALANMSVLAKGAAGEFSTTTDAQGKFRLELPNGEWELRVVDNGHKPFLQREKLAANDELKVRYLVDRPSYGGYESVVVGTRERTEVSRTTLSGDEITKVPGTFGDPYRVITVLPGVTTVMSLLPYPVVRGSSPANTGELLDGVRLPLLFHLLVGSSVIHPELLDHVDFYPGGFPVQYGGYTGGILDGVTKSRVTEPRTELNVNQQEAGFLLRRTFESTGITVTAAARDGYPGLMLSLLNLGINLSYWDYQLKVEGPLFGGQWTAFAYGARDDLDVVSTASDGTSSSQRIEMMQSHHVDLRWRKGTEDRELTARIVLLDDETGSGVGGDSFTRSLGLMPQLRVHDKLVPSLTFDAGLDGLARNITTVRSDAAQKTLALFSGLLEDSGAAYSGGAFAQLAWKPIDRLVLIPGARADVWNDSTNTRRSVDPRLLMRYRLRDGDVGQTWLKAVVGIYHQPPRISLPIPGIDEANLRYPLLASKQASVGAEVKLSPGVDVDVQTYYNANNPVIFDLSVNQDLSSVLNEAPSVAAGQIPATIPATGGQAAAKEALQRLIAPTEGRAYGLEVMLRKHDTQGFFGWVAYTLSHSERLKDGTWVPFDFDRLHILNMVGGVHLPRNWELGARLLLQTGTPVTDVHGYNAGRADPQFRLDVRVDKRAVWNSWLLDFYVDVINATVSPEDGGVLGGSSIQYVLPTVGFRAVL